MLTRLCSPSLAACLRTVLCARSLSALLLVAFSFIASFATPAHAQCGGTAGWQAGDPLLGVNGTVRALTVWDRDGAGPLAPELIVGGNFQLAGEAVTLNIASWDGSQFRPLTSGGLGTQPDSVYALTVYNGELVVGGTFLTASGVEVNAVASFNGVRWDRLGGGVWLDPVGARVYALTVYNGELIVAGLLARAGGQSMRNITKWNGSSWSNLASGLDGAIYALHVHNNELYAGGSFAASNGEPMGRVAKWNGSSWSSAGGEGLAASGAIVYSLATYAGRLTAGGSLPNVGNIAWLNGGSWQAISGGVSAIEPPSVRAIVVDGSELFITGAFTNAGGTAATNAARYNGSSWSAAGTGVSGTPLASVRYAGEVVVGGSFMLSAGLLPAGRIAAWNGASWRPLGRGFNDAVFAILPQGSSMIAGGAFEYAGSGTAKGVAVWENNAWRPMGQGLTSDDSTSSIVRSLVSHQGEVFAGGNFTRSGNTTGLANFAKWNGSAWTPVAGGVQGSVFTMLSNPATNTLFVGGSFTRAGSIDAARIARLVNGSWQTMGAGFSNGTSQTIVNALALYNNELYAGGAFSNSGSTSVLAIARWDGSAWRPVVNASSGVGLASGSTAAQVLAMTVHNGELIVGGTFASAGGEPETRALARWNGTRWARVAPPLETDIRFASVNVTALASTNDGLVVGGNFTSCAGLPALNIARWSNNTWSPFGAGVDVLPPLGSVRALATSGNDVLVGGDVRAAGGAASAGVARWATTAGTGGAPVFGTFATSLTRDCGTTAQLSSVLTQPGVGISVRWRRNGVVVVNGVQASGSLISGADTLNISVTNVKPADAGAWNVEASNVCGTTQGASIALTINACGPTPLTCDSIDFNNDGLFPTEQDLQDYLRVMMGAPCPIGRTCNDLDFNNDGLFPDDRDLAVFLRVFAGGSCE